MGIRFTFLICFLSAIVNDSHSYYLSGFNNVGKDCVEDTFINYYNAINYPNGSFDNSSLTVSYEIVSITVHNTIIILDNTIRIKEPELVLGNTRMPMDTNSSLTFPTDQSKAIINDSLFLVVQFFHPHQSFILSDLFKVSVPILLALFTVFIVKKRRIQR